MRNRRLWLPLACALLSLPHAETQAGRLPRYGGNLRVEAASLPMDLSPERLVGDAGESVSGNVFEALTRLGQRNVVPGLAVSWSKSDDAKRWVFRLRRNVSFHDGARCDAAAVVASLHRLARRSASRHTWILEDLVGRADFDAGRTQEIEGLSAAGSYELELRFARPVADLDARLALPAAAIARWDGRNLHGTGPFRVVSATSRGLRLVAFEDHRRGRPFLDGIDIVRDVDAPATPWGSDASMQRVLPSGDPPSGTVHVRGITRRLGLALVHPSSTALGTPAARLRVANGFDREVFVSASLGGDGAPARGLRPADDDLPQADPQDTEGDLMQQPRQTLRMLVVRGEPVLRRLGERLQVHLFASGLDADLKELPADAYEVALLADGYDIVLLGWTPPPASQRLSESSFVRYVLTHVLEPVLFDQLPPRWAAMLRDGEPATRASLLAEGHLIPLVFFHDTWQVPAHLQHVEPATSGADLGLERVHLAPRR